MGTDGTIVAVKCLELQAPKAVLELAKCECRGQCSPGGNCSCYRNNLPCTALCKCNDSQNMPDYTVASFDDGVDEINDE